MSAHVRRRIIDVIYSSSTRNKAIRYIEEYNNLSKNNNEFVTIVHVQLQVNIMVNGGFVGTEFGASYINKNILPVIEPYVSLYSKITTLLYKRENEKVLKKYYNELYIELRKIQSEVKTLLDNISFFVKPIETILNSMYPNEAPHHVFKWS
jgi:hypothetical protein